MPLLYKIQKDGKTHYLFGTLHIGLPEIQKIIPFYTQEFKNADVVVFESDLSLAETDKKSAKFFEQLAPDVQALFINYLAGYKDEVAIRKMSYQAELFRACTLMPLADRDQYDEGLGFSI